MEHCIAGLDTCGRYGYYPSPRPDLFQVYVHTMASGQVQFEIIEVGVGTSNWRFRVPIGSSRVREDVIDQTHLTAQLGSN
jgi:hypothetical protein